MGYTNSGLVAYTKLSPNHSGQRTHGIDRITPHCVVGQCSAEGLGDWFSKSSTQASSNYGIDKDGRVGLYVEEKNRSWCSSSNANDQRAITIECASDTTQPYAFRDAVYQKLIVLCADICKRNGKKKLLWLKNKEKTLNYSPKSDEMVLTVHRWFANKCCPGNWLMERMDDLAEKVTAQLGEEAAPAKAGLQQGDKGAAVKAMQTMLIACGYSCGSAGADGDFGRNTLTGLKAFQKAAGLTVDGVYGEGEEATLKKAYSAIATVTHTSTTDGKSDEQIIWETLNAAIGNAYGTAGLMGNLYAESALKATNLQNIGNKKLGMTDEQYTEAVDSGSYDANSFIHDGYGLAQWTYYSRKSALLSYAFDQGKSVGDLKTQLAFLLKDIKGYTSVWNTLTTASSVREASDIVLKKYEAPADQSETVQEKRAGCGQTYYDRYVQSRGSAALAVPATRYYRVRKSWKDKKSQIGAFTVFQNARNCVDANPGYAAFDDDGNQVYPNTAFSPYLVRITISELNYRKGPSTAYASWGSIESGVYTIVDEQDGWGLLKAYAEKRNGWIKLSYTTRV